MTYLLVIYILFLVSRPKLYFLLICLRPFITFIPVIILSELLNSLPYIQLVVLIPLHFSNHRNIFIQSLIDHKMMLRSSSTPILGSLLSSYSESPNHGNHSEFYSPKQLPNNKFTFHQTHTCPLNLIPPSSFSNSSPSFNAEFTSDGSHSSRLGRFRRVQSDGNLEGLASASCQTFDEFNHSIPAKKFPRKPNCSVLQSIPSLSVYNPKRQYGDDDDEEEESGEEAEEQRSENSSFDNSMAFMNNMGLQEKYYVPIENLNIPSKMHLARGLGVITGDGEYGSGGNGGYNEYKPVTFGDDGGDGASMAEHYKKMVEANPGNPMILRNYAEFLHKVNLKSFIFTGCSIMLCSQFSLLTFHQSNDLGGAEEYYSRAILVDPRDGEVLSQYAQLIWELHRDEVRASSYFQRAVQASPEDSHVHAAYASFLWDTEKEEDDIIYTTPPILHQTAAATAVTT